MNIKRIALLAVTALLAMGLAGCGGDDAADDTSAATTASTAAPATTTVAAETTTAPEATTTTADDMDDMGGGETTGTTIDVITDGDSFSVDEIRVTAGQEVTIVIEDRDTGTDEPHNFHVRAGDFNAFTNIEEAPNTQTLTFTIDTPGEYEFFCDTHSDTMKGLFIVEG